MAFDKEDLTREYKTLKDHGYKSFQFINAKIYAHSKIGSHKIKLGGFAEPYERICVIYKSGQGARIENTIMHEFTHFLFIDDNPGFLDASGNFKGLMTYNFYWRRDESDTKKTLVKDNGNASLLHEPQVIKAIRQIKMEDVK